MNDTNRKENNRIPVEFHGVNIILSKTITNCALEKYFKDVFLKKHIK
jgi:hypothetical protein